MADYKRYFFVKYLSLVCAGSNRERRFVLAAIVSAGLLAGFFEKRFVERPLPSAITIFTQSLRVACAAFGRKHYHAKGKPASIIYPPLQMYEKWPFPSFSQAQIGQKTAPQDFAGFCRILHVY